MSKELKENTVQHTLCMPLCGRMIAARKYPDLFPDRDAEYIVQELGEDISGRVMYRLQYMWINCVIRQCNLAWEITEYLKTHPKAVVVELGAGLSCLRRQMGNNTNLWYCLDMEDVIALREKHIPLGEHEHNIVYEDVIEINHCREGRFECEFFDGNAVYLGAGDLAVNILPHTIREIRAYLAEYLDHHITLLHCRNCPIGSTSSLFF